MTERTNVIVPEEDKLILKSLGFNNFSEFVRDCIDGALATEEEICPQCGQLINRRKVRAMEIGRQVRKKKEKQKTIISGQELAQAQAENYHKEHSRAIAEAIGLSKINPRTIQHRLPENDPHGDFVEFWSDYADRLSDTCGFTVTISELQSFARRGLS